LCSLLCWVPCRVWAGRASVALHVGTSVRVLLKASNRLSPDRWKGFRVRGRFDEAGGSVRVCLSSCCTVLYFAVLYCTVAAVSGVSVSLRLPESLLSPSLSCPSSYPSESFPEDQMALAFLAFHQSWMPYCQMTFRKASSNKFLTSEFNY